MKFLFKLLLLAFLLLPFAAAGLFILALQDTPTVVQNSPLLQKDIDQALKLLGSTRKQVSSETEVKIIRFTGKDLNLLADYLMMTVLPKNIHQAQRVNIQSKLLHHRFSIGIQQPAAVYLNLSYNLSRHHDRLRITHLRIGQFSVPDKLSEIIVQLSATLLAQSDLLSILQQSLVDYRITDNRLELYLRNLSIAEQRARNKLRSFTENEDSRVYAAKTARLLKTSSVTLDQLLAHLFEHARQRSASTSAVQQNRALLLMLGNWALGKQHFENITLPAFNLRLNNRHDLARHMLISAAITANSSRLISNLIGTGKEIKDSMGGSGFSFDDLAADRLGTYLGEQATHNENTALAIQNRFSDNRLNIEIHNLASHPIAPMTNREFTARFGSVDDPRYQKQLEFIDVQIQNSRLFQP